MSVIPIVSLDGVSKDFKAQSFAGVAGVSLQIHSGSIVSIVGHSGSGKSTLLKLIYGLISPDSGTVSFRGELVQGPDRKLIPGHERMKMVTQDFSLNIYAKVYDNIASMLPNTDLKAKKEETLEMMEFLRIDHLADKRVTDLSGGEQQRVAIARAIITEPEVLLLDEPFNQLDTLMKSELRADLRRLAHFLNITVILVSHDPADALSLADLLIILKEGKVVESGKPENLYHNPATLYTSRLLANSNVLSADEALVVGIESNKKTVVIYPEWVQPGTAASGVDFRVKDCFFKGFYEELVLEKDGVCLNMVNTRHHAFEKGQIVSVAIRRYLEFGE